MLRWQRDRRKLWVVQIREKIGHPRFYVAGVLNVGTGPSLETPTPRVKPRIPP